MKTKENKYLKILVRQIIVLLVVMIIISPVKFVEEYEKPVSAESYWYEHREPYSGSGTEEDPFIIDSAEKLGMVSYRTWAENGGYDLDGYFKLTKDIDLAGHYFFVIGYNSFFTGVFDGNGHVLYNVTIVNGWCGIIERLDYGIIKNLGLVDVTIEHNYSGGRVGTICGAMQNNSLIENCFVTCGNISTYGDIVGGIVGTIERNCIVRNCFVSDVAISAVPEAYVYMTDYSKTLTSKGQIREIDSNKFQALCDVEYSKKLFYKSDYDLGGIVGRGLVGSEHSGLIENCYAHVKSMNTTYNAKISDFYTAKENNVWVELSYSYLYDKFGWNENTCRAFFQDSGAPCFIGMSLDEFEIDSQGKTFTLKENRAEEKFLGRGISDNNSTITNCHYACEEDNRGQSLDTLRGYASVLGEEYLQNDNINNGLPYLKVFKDRYWQNVEKLVHGVKR